MKRIDRQGLARASLNARRRLARWLRLECNCVECLVRELDRRDLLAPGDHQEKR